MQSTLAPIVLFVYNRPWHTIQTLEALAKNDLANETILYIYADGPKESADEKTMEKMQETRACLKKQQWCKEVIIVERETNLGLANSIITGVTAIVNKYGKVIVLEDDIVTSPGFLQFMNDALNVYAKEERVWHISGYWYPAKNSDKLPKTFFFNAATCWGWATWQRAWSNLITDANEIKQKILKSEDGVFHFNVEDAYPFFTQIQLNIDNELSTWAVKWYGSIFINNALSLHPNHSLTNNFGFDKTGINCEESSYFTWPVLAKSIRVNAIPLVESELSRRLLKPFFNPWIYSQKSSLKGIMQFKSKVKSLIHKFLLKKGIKLNRITNDSFDYLKDSIRYQKQKVPLMGKEFLVADGMSFYYNYKEIFESEIYNFFSKSSNPLIIDCGCNYGTSILYFKSIYPKAEIIGFEPDPYIFNIAKKNIGEYGLENVTLINKGLWKEVSTLAFYSERADGGRLGFTGDNSEHEKIEVETTILSKFLSDRKVDFLKIDIEGAELEVLLECEVYLVNVSYLFVEYHSFIGKEQQLNELLSILTRNKFRYLINSISESKTPFISKSIGKDMDLQLNIFAFRD